MLSETPKAMMPRADARSEPQLLGLLDELIAAHEDTVRLLAECADRLRWEAHADYLRALERLGRSALADAAAAQHPTSLAVSKVVVIDDDFRVAGIHGVAERARRQPALASAAVPQTG